MKYQHIVQAEFIDRPNRFIAHVCVKGQEETVHIKNTGRCRELLEKGAVVYLEKSHNPARATAYDLVAVKKGERLINMDSQAPNKAVAEWLLTGELFPDLISVRPETRYGSSRFDFYAETAKEKIWMEVKGVTLEKDGVVRFPDAPSDRAVKHLEELIQAKRDGYRVCIIFVVQMEGVKYFLPNESTHPEFAEALRRAAEAGVELLAYDCRVTPDSMLLNSPVKIFLTEEEQILAEISQPLLKWYDENHRILPWRETPTPYRVWVSEIMLQQTRVEAVKPYFERFMKSLPDIRALAEAEEELLLKLWEGLGYYNRVRNLKAAAIQIMEEYGGRMPDSYEELLKLKGIGSYTAGAISSIAYGRANPAVDGNVLRVISRILKEEGQISDTKVKQSVEKALRRIIPVERPGDFNQAMMEIGACICIPNGAPKCEQCPLQQLCRAHKEGVELEYPKKAAPKQRAIEKKTILVIRDANRTVIRKRADKGLLAGMYEFPMLEGFQTPEAVAGYLAENGLKLIRILPLEDAKHIFSHKEWHMKGYMARVDELEPKKEGETPKDWIFIEAEAAKEKYPIPAAFAAYAKGLNIKLGNDKFMEE